MQHKGIIECSQTTTLPLLPRKSSSRSHASEESQYQVDAMALWDPNCETTPATFASCSDILDVTPDNAGFEATRARRFLQAENVAMKQTGTGCRRLAS